MIEMTVQKEEANWWDLLMESVSNFFTHIEIEEEEENLFLIE
jgi:hypothetical protein